MVFIHFAHVEVRLKGDHERLPVAVLIFNPRGYHQGSVQSAGKFCSFGFLILKLKLSELEIVRRPWD